MMPYLILSESWLNLLLTVKLQHKLPQSLKILVGLPVRYSGMYSASVKSR